MPSSPISRRRFLTSSLLAGGGAVALGATGGGAWAAAIRYRAAAAGISPPAAPAATQTFVSRPDLTPPAVSVTQAVDVASLPGQPPYIFLAPRPNSPSAANVGTQGVMICDLSGELVYWAQVGAPDAGSAFNFHVQAYRGQPVLTYTTADVGIGYGIHGTGHILDTSYGQVATTTVDRYDGQDLHELLLTPEDTALVTSYQLASDVLYGHALEIDVATGDIVYDWSSEAVPTSLSYVARTAAWDYFHINSIDLWPGSARNLLVSSRNTWAVYLVERSSGAVLWRAGGKDSSFAMGTGTHFEFQHDARALLDGSGISVFDDASAPNGYEQQSWGKVLTIDQAARTASIRHQYNHTDGLIDTGSQGNNQLLATGGHFVGWGAYPYFSLFGPSGDTVIPPLLLDGRLPDNTNSYRSFNCDWTATPPTSEIALVVKPGAGTGNYTAYTSWNGATEVASWRINAGVGSTPTELTTIHQVPKTGFETVIPFTVSGASDFQTVAFDAAGTDLGRSPIVNAG